MPEEPDLNKLSTRFFHGSDFTTDLPAGARYSEEKLKNYSVESSNGGRIAVRFEKIEELFVDLARKHEVVVGAVAWLTNNDILSALSTPAHVAIVVQKEDFLRRDSGVTSYPRWRHDLRCLYNAIRPFDMLDFKETYPGQQEDHPDYNPAVQHWLFNASGEFQVGGEPIRCLGYAVQNNRQIPKMHHKFLVFGDRQEGLIMRPRCVVTGSFNLTQNAVRSRENVIVVEDQAICHAFISEWAQLWCLSEKLDWSSPEPVVEEMNMAT
ncbi:MAG: phospholipase D-like domain-containing protein [Rhodomicrobium sp.]